MKYLFACLTLTLAACISAPIDTVKVEGALERQIERVLARHDTYVIADEALSAELAEVALVESDGVRDLAALPEVRRDSLGAALRPVSARHDAYVNADATLEDIERETFLAATEQLGRLLAPPR